MQTREHFPLNNLVAVSSTRVQYLPSSLLMYNLNTVKHSLDVLSPSSGTHLYKPNADQDVECYHHSRTSPRAPFPAQPCPHTSTLSPEKLLLFILGSLAWAVSNSPWGTAVHSRPRSSGQSEGWNAAPLHSFPAQEWHALCPFSAGDRQALHSPGPNICEDDHLENDWD